MSIRDSSPGIAIIAVAVAVAVNELLTGDIRLIALALCAGLLIVAVVFATGGDTNYNPD